MTLLYVAVVLAFDTVLSLVEVPRMIRDKLFKELTIYSICLLLGSAIFILRSLDIKIPNPSDLIIWIYSPLSGISKWLTQK